jgi:xanthine dehydrogenase YagR molybdenum-binding subunit
LRPQYQLFLAVLAARELKRPVRVNLTRQQMFTIGYRPATLQRVALGARSDGKLVSVMHEALGNTSCYEDYQENDVNWAGVVYNCENRKFGYKLVQLDLQTPIDMRAPGGSTGMYALESAMDELAYKLKMDPLELRLKNYSQQDQNENLPFSSKELRACYLQGAERFGWARRNPQPRSMREGDRLIGWGMATGIWEAMQHRASARAVLSAAGKLLVCSATADIGTGTYTIMRQIAAERLGLGLEDVRFELGDSSLPTAPVEGGSFTAATVGSAVAAACDKMRERLLALAKRLEGSPLGNAQLNDVTFDAGQIRLSAHPSCAVSIDSVLRHARGEKLEAEASAGPTQAQERYARYAHSAIFCEVTVDEDLAVIEVTRMLNAVAGGRIINPKTARSQIIGGIVWGIGMALQEESVVDHKFGRIMNHNLAEYHVPVNADVQAIEVIFVEERDEIVNPLGVKGLGELGLVGTAAAIANAVFHATGKRVRDLPITLDKLL